MAVSPEHQPPTRAKRPFREVVLASGLVTTGDLDGAEAVATTRAPAVPSPPGDAAPQRGPDAAVAAVLVEQGRLTPFQAREILAGRTRFRLGQYTVIDEIGRGGMGQVFEAEHALMGRRVAVKVLPRSKATPESEAAFRREMRILGRLDHENLVRAFDAGYDAMVYYLVTELVPGMDLRRAVRTHGPLDEVAAASVFSQVARALSFAHAQGLVHRDVKPGNVLVMDDGRVKLLDLGLAGSTLEAEAVRLGRVVGTMDYIAPEQIRTPDDVGPAADIYALGCSLYFALTGAVPFPGGSRKDKMRRHLTEAPVPIRKVAPHIPHAMCHVVEAMMAKSAADRIGSADEVIRRLARWTPDRPTPLASRPQLEPAAAAPSSVSGVSGVDGADAVSGGACPVFEERGPAADQEREGGWTDVGLSPAVWRSLREIGSTWGVPIATRVLVPALLSGVGFTIAVSLVRAIEPARFDDLVGITPAACGWGAFVLMAFVQAVSLLGRRRR